jgi:hypothetical protein
LSRFARFFLSTIMRQGILHFALRQTPPLGVDLPLLPDRRVTRVNKKQLGEQHNAHQAATGDSNVIANSNVRVTRWIRQRVVRTHSARGGQRLDGGANSKTR